MEGQNMEACQEYAILVTKLLNDIKVNVGTYRMLKDEYDFMRQDTLLDSKKIENQAEKIHTLIDGIYKRYLVSNGNTTKQPSKCGDNILDFMEKVLKAKPTWFKESKLFEEALDWPYAVEMIRMIDPLTPTKIEGGGVRRSFKKRTTSTRKSIKRSRGNRRRYRRTARK